MKLEVNVLNILLVIGSTFIMSYLLIFVCKKLAIHIGAIDVPDESRRIHKNPTPRMGGLAIFFSFLFGYLVFGDISTKMISVLIGSFILVLVGAFDDIKSIPGKYKLLCQLVAALIVVFYGGFLLQEIDAFGIYINFHGWAYPITIFFIVGCVNCINFIDGMDGLSGGICSICFLTVGVIAAITNKLTGLDVLLAFSALGATLGYLKHNFHPAKIFMGDGGAMFLGFIIAIIALTGYKNVTFSSFMVPLALLAIPILDTLLAIIRRLLKHQSPFTPDRFHLHFQLLNINHSVKRTVLIIYAVDLLFAAITIFYVLKKEKIAMIIYIFLMILLLILIVKTDILYEHKKEKK